MNRVVKDTDILLENKFMNIISDKLDDIDITYEYYLAGYNTTKKQKILNHLFIRECMNDNLDIFIESLKYVDYLEKYIKNVIVGNDLIAKAYLCIFLNEDLIEELFNDEETLIKVIISDKTHNFNDIICLLITLTTLDISDSSYELIKSIIPKYVKSNKEINKEDKEDLIEDYLNTIESNRGFIKEYKRS